MGSLNLDVDIIEGINFVSVISDYIYSYHKQFVKSWVAARQDKHYMLSLPHFCTFQLYIDLRSLYHFCLYVYCFKEKFLKFNFFHSALPRPVPDQKNFT